MKIAIMQPYFFPYLGYFSLIKHTDKFIFFDTPQYIKHGWVNRNRILKQDGEPHYFIVPIKKASQQTAINKVEINNAIPWKEKIYGQLTVYKKKAPFYQAVMDFLHGILDMEYSNLSKLNILSTVRTCQFLGIDIDYDVYSNMDLQIENVNAPDEWALRITEKLGYEVYVNPIGGLSFFDREKYKLQNIKLEFLRQELIPYIQKIGHFEEGLSIIDLMMFCDTKTINKMMESYAIIE